MVTPSFLNFSATDWTTEKTVTVSASDDGNSINEMATLTHTASGVAYGSGSVTAESVSVTVMDNDTPGVRISDTAITVPEGGTNAYTVRLNTQPGGNVEVAVSGATGDVSIVSSPALTFTTSTWNQPQTVTVMAEQDDDAVSETVTLTHGVSGYGSVTSGADVVVTVEENDSPGFTFSPASVTVLEEGSSEYTVVLDTEPTASVRVAIGGASGEVTFRPSSLDFTTSNWNVPQTITVSADMDADSIADTATLSHTASGGDYGSVSVTGDVTVTVTDNDTPGVTVAPTDLSVSEGTTNSYTVRLNTQPSGDVTITPSRTGDGDVSFSPAFLTFTTSDWNTEKMVTVSASEDDDGVNDTATLSHSSSGANYGSVVVDSVSVTVADNDPRGVTISTATLTVNEGGSDTYTVRLNTQPTGSVAVTVGGASGDVSIAGSSVLNFTTSGWNTEQTVTVMATEDADSVNDTVSLTHTVSGADYGSVTAAGVAVTVEDNDTPGVRISANALTVPEGGTNAYTVRLNTQPGGNVEVTVSGASGDVSIDGSSVLTFTTSNWNQPQAINVMAMQDADGEQDAAVTLTHSVSGYGAVDTAPDVVVAITEDDEKGLTINNPATLTLNEEGEAITYGLSLATEPFGSNNGRVIVAIGASDEEGAVISSITVSPSSLTFTTSDWNTEQSVTVSADEDSDGLSQSVMLTYTFSGGGYDSVAVDTSEAMLTVEDDDGVTFTDADGNEINEITVNEGESVTYTVALNSDPDESDPAGDVIIGVTTSDSLTLTPSMLTFTGGAGNWNEPQTVTFDANTQGTFTLAHEVTGYIADATVNITVTVRSNTSDEEVVKRSLGAFARIVATGAMDAIGGRFSSSGSARSRIRGSLGGESIDSADSLTTTLYGVFDGLTRVDGTVEDGELNMLSNRDLLAVSEFEVMVRNGDDQGTGAWTVWGKGDYTNFESEPLNDLSLDGDVIAGYLGADYRVSRNILVGGAVSYASGDIDYNAGSSSEGSVEATLTSLYPYWHWSPTERFETWTILGIGIGEAEFNKQGESRIKTDIRNYMIAAGGRHALLQFGLIEMGIKADAFASWIDSDSAGSLGSVDASAQRLRLSLDFKTEDLIAVSEQYFAPGLEFGVRFDGGDAETGTGVDVGGSLGYAHVLGVSVDFRGRVLLAHQENDFSEWGLSLTARAGPGSEKRGVLFSVSSSLGADSRADSNAIWESNSALSGEGDTEVRPRMVAEIGYAMGMRNGNDKFMPFARMEFESGDSHNMGVGARFDVGGGRLSGLGLELLGEQREQRDELPDYRLGLTGKISF